METLRLECGNPLVMHNALIEAMHTRLEQTSNSSMFSDILGPGFLTGSIRINIYLHLSGQPDTHVSALELSLEKIGGSSSFYLPLPFLFVISLKYNFSFRSQIS